MVTISGAHHHARFMAYAIYFIKIELLSERFSMTDEESRNVKRMANFIALFHTRPFLQSRLASMAPAVDLKYLSLMNLYKKTEENVAAVAIHSVLNHLWYLTEELVIFSLFDDDLPANLRQGMIDKLLSFPRPKSIQPGKPKFPTLNPDSINYPFQLLSFIGPKSWLIFICLITKMKCLIGCMLQCSIGIKCWVIRKLK